MGLGLLAQSTTTTSALIEIDVHQEHEDLKHASTSLYDEDVGSTKEALDKLDEIATSLLGVSPDTYVTTGNEWDYDSKTAQIELKNFMNAQFIGYTYVGGRNDSKSPNLERVRMIYDTGSSWTWVQQTGCKAAMSDPVLRPEMRNYCTKRPELYDTSKSEFNKKQGSTIYLAYGIGSANGDLMQDRVCLD